MEEDFRVGKRCMFVTPVDHGGGDDTGGENVVPSLT